MHRHDPLGKGVPVPRPLPPAGLPWARTLALARCLENQIARAAYEDEDLLDQGVRAPTLGGVHPWGSPGVESSTAQNGTTWYLLIGLEKHKMLPVFPGQPCVWIKQGEFSCSINRC